MVTLKKISELAGCSRTTVAMVVDGNKTNRVSAKTEAKIKEIIKLTGYRPNLKAKSLKNGKTMNVAVITDELFNPFYAHYIAALRDNFEPHGYSVFPFETCHDLEREKRILKWIEQGFFDGCICLELSATNRQIYLNREKNNIPIIYRCQAGLHIEGCSTVCVDYAKATHELFNHLSSENWKKVAISRDEVIHPKTTPLEYGIDHELCIVENNTEQIAKTFINVPSCVDMDQNLKLSYDAFYNFLKANRDVDVVIVRAAKTILAVYRAINDLGLELGKDIAIATFSNIPTLEYLTPRPSFVKEDYEVIANELVNMSLAQMQNNAKITQLTFDAQLVIKESTIKKEGEEV